MRTKQIESSTSALISTRALWTKLRLRKTTDSIFIKVVWFQETSSESSTSRVSILKHAVELMLTTQQKLDGSSLSRHRESLMVL